MAAVDKEHAITGPVGQRAAGSRSCCSLGCSSFWQEEITGPSLMLPTSSKYPVSLGAVGTKGREVCSGLECSKILPCCKITLAPSSNRSI